jgi:putative N6-adenine-specific DNA methylase
VARTSDDFPGETGLDLFLATAPGLEPVLEAEAAAAGLRAPRAVPGGVALTGTWPDVWRANLRLRGATRVLVRIASFRALHLAQLDKRARKVPWAATLRTDVPVRIEATSRKSRIYHAGAARQRVATAIRETLGAPVLAVDDESAEAVVLRVRLDDDLCTISVDTSGAPLHRRGHKQAVNAAPMRETLASLFLRACGYTGAEPVLDPMCGSGTFPIEAAEIACGLAPGRSRSFAFERLAIFDPADWAAAKGEIVPRETRFRFHGSDRDAGAIAMAESNAARAGVSAITAFSQAPVSALARPDGPPGLVIVNPPYGTRLGDAAALRPLHAALGDALKARFAGWRVGLVTTEPALASATGLPFGPPGPWVPHGGLKVRLWQTGPLRP